MLSELSAEQITALEQFRDLQIGFDELQAAVAPLIVFTFNDGCSIRIDFKASLPVLLFNMAHIDAAKAKLEPKMLSSWANMMLLIDAYDWSGTEEEEEAIAEELNRLAFD